VLESDLAAVQWRAIGVELAKSLDCVLDTSLASVVNSRGGLDEASARVTFDLPQV